jgi:hypothetical protein
MGHIITEFVALVLITVGYLFAAIALSLAVTVMYLGESRRRDGRVVIWQEVTR